MLPALFAYGRYSSIEPEKDPGVVAVSTMHHYFKKFGHGNTIVMPASWRPSRGGAGYDLDEVRSIRMWACVGRKSSSLKWSTVL